MCCFENVAFSQSQLLVQSEVFFLNHSDIILVECMFESETEARCSAAFFSKHQRLADESDRKIKSHWRSFCQNYVNSPLAPCPRLVQHKIIGCRRSLSCRKTSGVFKVCTGVIKLLESMCDSAPKKGKMKGFRKRQDLAGGYVWFRYALLSWDQCSWIKEEK